MKKQITLTIMAVSLLSLMSCGQKDPDRKAVEEMLRNDGGIAEAAKIQEEVPRSKTDPYITSTFENLKVSWHIFKNKVHVNGYIIIDRIDNTVNGKVFQYQPSDVSNDLDYIEQVKLGSTNMNWVSLSEEGKIVTFKQISDTVNLANAIIIVSYKQKKFDVSTSAASVNNCFAEIIKHQVGVSAINEIEKW